MRIRKILHRSVKTSVQQMNVVNQKQLMSDFLSGKTVDLNTGNTNSSYDFPDGEIDWDKELMEGFSNKLEQYMNRSKLVEHLRPVSKKSDDVDPVDPVDPVDSVDPVDPVE